MSSFPFLSKWLCGLRVGLFLLLIQSKALSKGPKGQRSTSQERVLFQELGQWKGPTFGSAGQAQSLLLGAGWEGPSWLFSQVGASDVIVMSS